MTSLTSVPGKLAQTVIQDGVSGHLEKNRQVMKSQPGF